MDRSILVKSFHKNYECLRTDPSKVILLKFYLGNTEDSLMLNQSNKNRVLCYASISLIIPYPQFKNDKQLCTKCLYYLVRMGKILRQKLYATEEYHDKNKL